MKPHLLALQAESSGQCEHRVRHALMKATRKAVTMLQATRLEQLNSKSKAMLTVMSDGITLKQTETIITLVSWNLKTNSKQNKVRI